MARTPFKLRSGNASTFKNLGSSPAKQGSSGSPRYTSPIDHPDGPDGYNKPKLDVPKKNEVDGAHGETETVTNKKTNKKTTKGPIMPKSMVKPPPYNNKNEGTLKGLTNFEYDMIPVTNVLNKIAKPYKKVGEKVLEVHKKINPIATYKKVKKYFTKK